LFRFGFLVDSPPGSRISLLLCVQPSHNLVGSIMTRRNGPQEQLSIKAITAAVSCLDSVVFANWPVEEWIIGMLLWQ
jgi:hypothetical protein